MPNSDDIFDIDRVLSGHSRTEGDIVKDDIFLILGEVCRQHHIRQIEIRRHFRQIFLKQRTLHQPKWSIGIRHFDTENDPQKKQQYLLHDLAAESVLPIGPGADDGIIFFAKLPERLEFEGVCLAIGIRLEDVICSMLDCITVAVNQGRTMTAVRFCKRYKVWSRLGKR